MNRVMDTDRELLRNADPAAFGMLFERHATAVYNYCFSERALAIVREELDAHGYSDWKVETTGEAFTPERPCAEVSFDGGSKTVLLLAGTRK